MLFVLHYPNQTRWYELCDEYGLYVIDEANLETHGTWQKLGLSEPSWNIPASEPEWLPACLDRANNMFQRDKNHASVIIWSCGNESYAGKDIADMADYFRSVDNTRPVHYEGVTWCREFDYITDIEVVCMRNQLILKNTSLTILKNLIFHVNTCTQWVTLVVD